MRLDHMLSSTGKWSRKEARALIRAGRVSVNGEILTRPEAHVAPEEARLLVDGEESGFRRQVYLMLHKPAGVLSATEDCRGETVLDLLPEHLRRIGLFPVGRLDKDSEGLLLLTNDGALGHALLSPQRHVPKVYEARTQGAPDASDAAAFAAGMTLGDGLKTLPAQLEPTGEDTCLVTLYEGKFHQVKRMLAARGKPVLHLKRLSMGPLALDGSLAPGQWRALTPEELEALKTLAK